MLSSNGYPILISMKTIKETNAQLEKFSITKMPVSSGWIGDFVMRELLEDGGAVIDDTLLVATAPGTNREEFLLGCGTNRNQMPMWTDKLLSRLEADKPKLYTAWKRNDNKILIVTEGNYRNFKVHLIKRESPCTIKMEACMDRLSNEKAVELVYAMAVQFEKSKLPRPCMEHQVAYNYIRYIDMAEDKLKAAQKLIDDSGPIVLDVIKKAFKIRGAVTARTMVNRLTP